jgi:hypothetical protein
LAAKDHRMQPGTRRVSAAALAADVSARTRPSDRDIVVSRDPASPLHTIGQVPGGAQFTSASRERALRLASAFARQHGVDVWYRDGDTCRRVEAFRPVPADV